MWPPTVGARVRPVISAPETVTPDGDPVPTPGAGPMWARLRYPAPSTGDDRLLATVADVEGLDGDGGDAAGVATASVVWEDGTEEDGVSLRALGPRRADDADAKDEEEEEEEEEEEASGYRRSRSRAEASRARGNDRFRRGDEAAAAAEYVEACAWLIAAIGPARARALPGRENDWNVHESIADAAAVERAATTTTATKKKAPALTPTVGMRVRVMGADGSSRAGMVSYVEEDDRVCDVMFDDDDDGGGGGGGGDDDDDDEEVGVPFDRLFGLGGDATADAADAAADDDARRSRREAAATATARVEDVVATLSDVLLNVARCHLKLSASRAGGSSAAHACVAACTASLSLRRNVAALYLRGRARTILCQFKRAGEDLMAALEVHKRRRIAADGERRRGSGGDAGDAETSPAAATTNDDDDDDEELDPDDPDNDSGDDNGIERGYVDSDDETDEQRALRAEEERAFLSAPVVNAFAGGDDDDDASATDPDPDADGAIARADVLTPAVAAKNALSAMSSGERETRVALRALKAAARRRAAADRKLAKAVLGHVRASGVDAGLDPKSDPLARVAPVRDPHEMKGGVPLSKIGEVFRDHVVGKVAPVVRGRGCVVS